MCIRDRPEIGSAHSSDLEKINGNTYLFGPNGVPVYGIQKVYLDRDESEYTAYYFGNRSQSSMLRGKQKIDDGGEMREYYFTSTGRGYTGAVSYTHIDVYKRQEYPMPMRFWRNWVSPVL